MTTLRRRFVVALIGVAAVLLAALAILIGQLPSAAANGLLRPARRRVVRSPPSTCQDATFVNEGVTLKGWQCHTATARRGTIVYLHGIADNRSSGVGIVQRFGVRGFDVVTYDSRAHGESGGDVCTYGFFEKDDLRRVLDGIGPGPIVLMGTSLGAAVALQEAARDARVTAVVAAETFSDLRTVATERAPFFLTPAIIARAFRIAEQKGHFQVDEVSPAMAAREIKIPVLLIHGSADSETPPEHSQRVLASLAGPKRLILVPGARHNESLRADVWAEVENWLDGVIGEARQLDSAHGHPPESIRVLPQS